MLITYDGGKAKPQDYNGLGVKRDKGTLCKELKFNHCGNELGFVSFTPIIQTLKLFVCYVGLKTFDPK